MFSYIKHQNHN